MPAKNRKTSVVGSLATQARRISRSDVAQASAVNYVTVGVMAVSSILVARALGPDGRGDFAAIMAWFAVALVIGEVGQSGAVVHWVSRQRQRAPELIASGRLIMTLVSVVVAAAAMAAAPILAGGDSSLTFAYWLAFSACMANGFWGAFIYATQAVSLRMWNLLRISQPLSYVIAVVVLFLLDALTIVTLAAVLAGSSVLQLAASHVAGSRLGLTGGRASRAASSDLAGYGLSYAGSNVTSTLSTQYDRVVLSQAVSSAALGQYAVAGTIAGLSAPLATAIASVFFPRLSYADIDRRLRRALELRAILMALGSTTAVMAGLALVAIPLVPWLFGEEFQPAVVLVWWLAPAMLFRGVSAVVTVLIHSRSRPGLVLTARLSGLVIGAVTVLPLINELGVIGAAVSLTILEVAILVISLALFAHLRRTDTPLLSSSTSAEMVDDERGLA